MAKRKRRKPKRPAPKRTSWLATALIILIVLGGAVLAGWIYLLDRSLTARFEGRLWDVPAHVYARPFSIYAGLKIDPAAFARHLEALGYRRLAGAPTNGTFAVGAGRVIVATRPYRGQFGPVAGMRAAVAFDSGVVSGVADLVSGQNLSGLELEPSLIGSILPLRHEDRAPIALHDVPEPLLQAILVMEDRNFANHLGVDPKGLMRAIWLNLKAGRVVAGGSTITQQLVKNLYLTAERTYGRKFVELLLALLLEYRYTKHEILEAYVNEVFLGQSGNRAIHGFALASLHYFGRPLNELGTPEYALLAGMVKAPTSYNPKRNPERALARRAIVLTELAEAGLIDPARLDALKKAPLGVAKASGRPAAAYSSFLDYTRRQIRRDFDPADLRSTGLRINTTMDSLIQSAAETALAGGLKRLEAARGLKDGSLQGAILVIRVENGEVLAVVGDRYASRAGFNRVLDASRPAGSLLKPAVYLSALEARPPYTLLSRLNDEPLSMKQSDGTAWQPRNYDRRSHGRPTLLEALTHSYNIATARLGLDLGIDEVVASLNRLGVVRSLKPFPSLTLGAVDLTPVEIGQMYQAIANGGYQAPLRTVTWIQDSEGRAVARYPLRTRTVIEPAPAYLLNFALQNVVAAGTARSAGARFNPALGLAGKTGTTNGNRDSWFAGYSGNFLAVVWVGRDNNQATGLTGASGALTIWSDLMARLPLSPVSIQGPDDLVMVEVNRTSLTCTNVDSGNAVAVPFAAGTVPNSIGCRQVSAEVAGSATDEATGTFTGWLRNIMPKRRESGTGETDRGAFLDRH